MEFESGFIDDLLLSNGRLKQFENPKIEQVTLFDNRNDNQNDNRMVAWALSVGSLVNSDGA